MGDTRIVYGLAYGKQNNFYTIWQGKTHGLFAQANTAPDVTLGVLFDYTRKHRALIICKNFSIFLKNRDTIDKKAI